MNETLEQRLSMLLDGEITPFETKRLVDEIHCNPHIKALWFRMNKQRAALKGELIDPTLDISASVMSHLNSTPQISHSNTKPSKILNRNIPLLGNEALLVDLGSNFNGNLKNYRMVSENAIEANYQLSDNEAVKIKVFFNDVPQSERLNLLESGITLHTKSGNEPIVLNVSSDQISKSKLIKISNTFFTK